MPRSARIVLPGCMHHITQRGNYQQNVFEEDLDHIVYLKLIQKNCQEYGVDIFAFCLMKNHVHFIVRPTSFDSLAQAFKITHMCYALYFNQKKNIKGHLWQSRFYSCHLHEDHFYEAVRYVECNPMRAKMVLKPWDYSWSSAKAHLGTRYNIIQLADIKEHLDVGSWKDYLMKTESDDFLKAVRNNTKKGLVVGPNDYLRELENKLNRPLLPKPFGRPSTTDLIKKSISI